MSKKQQNNRTRALFVEWHKKNQKEFLDAVVSHLLVIDSYDHEDSPDVAWNLGLLKHVIENNTASARLWDTAHDTYLEVYWDSLGRVINNKISQLEKEIYVLESIDDIVVSTGPDDLNQVIDNDPVIDPANTDMDDGSIFNDPDEYDDEDDDDDGSPAVFAPPVLYHATPTDNVNDIMTDGLKSMQRQNVYLWETKEKALEVADRHGTPDIAMLEVNVKAFEASGGLLNYHDFGHGDGMQWFTPDVPSVYLTIV